MKKKIFVFIIGLFSLLISGGFYIKHEYFDTDRRTEKQIKTWNERIQYFQDKTELKNGDIIFQTSLSGQSKAIQLATNSKYSHCGIIFIENGQIYVFEAVQPVKTTPLDKWIARGENGHFVVKRLINGDEMLTIEALSKMKIEGEKLKGKDYDLTFEWSDDQIYCSELIWKIYKRATGLEIGNLQKLEDFDLTSDAVKTKMKERYGENIPMDEIVISPAAIFNSKLLETIKSN